MTRGRQLREIYGLRRVSGPLVAIAGGGGSDNEELEDSLVSEGCEEDDAALLAAFDAARCPGCSYHPSYGCASDCLVMNDVLDGSS